MVGAALIDDAGRVLVGFSTSSATCGLGIIDASDPDPVFWLYVGTDTSLVTCPRVVVPVP